MSGQIDGRRGDTCRLSIAPMMEWTDRHYRYMMRLITRCTTLYTEMITASAILFGDKKMHLTFSNEEHPLIIQLGGSDPQQLKESAQIAEDWGYDEINLNVGCPSSRVRDGAFGACLMATPELVAELVEAMRSVVSIPVTVKHRIGIDDLGHYEDLCRFVDIVKESGCDRFIVHARIAILGGLTPKENRTIPPLRFEDVYQLKRDFPELWIEGNGQVKSLEEVQEKLNFLDGVMIGRAAYENPFLFANADSVVYDQEDPGLTRREVVEAMIPYIERVHREGTPIKCVTRHMLNLFKGQPGGKRWRRSISESRELSDIRSVLYGALDAMSGRQ